MHLNFRAHEIGFGVLGWALLWDRAVDSEEVDLPLELHARERRDVDAKADALLGAGLEIQVAIDPIVGRHDVDPVAHRPAHLVSGEELGLDARVLDLESAGVDFPEPREPVPIHVAERPAGGAPPRMRDALARIGVVEPDRAAQPDPDAAELEVRERA